MAKTAVYSWRLAPDLKRSLESEARRNDESLAELLDRVVREWLERSVAKDAAEEARRCRAAALRAIGTFDSGDPDRSTNARRNLRQRLARRHGHTP